MFKHRFLPLVVFKPDEPPAAPVVPAPVVTAPPAIPAPAGDAPWATDLATYVQDEASRAAADRYIREKVQPRITQLEQTVAGDEVARKLYKDFLENPEGTYIAVGEQLYGEDPNLVASLKNLFTDPEPGTEPTAAPIPPEIQELIDERAAAKRQTQYDTNYQTVESQWPADGPPLVRELFDPFVVIAKGEFATAAEAYKTWATQFKSTVDPTTPPPAEPPAPATLGTTDANGTPPPAVVEKYESLDGALDAFLGELREARTIAPVGTV